MPHPALPSHISPNRAAALWPTSRAHINKLIENGLLLAEVTAGGHRRIPLASLERLIGREIGPDEWGQSNLRWERRNNRGPGHGPQGRKTAA